MCTCRLAVDHFESQASNAVLDFTADEENQMIKTKKMKQTWFASIVVSHFETYLIHRDRKRKRFVTETGNEKNTKKVKTESGQWIKASYKSGMYVNSQCDKYLIYNLISLP